MAQPQIQQREIRLVKLAEGDAFRNCAGYAANLVAGIDERLFQHVGHHEIVFGNHDLEHNLDLRVGIRTRRRLMSSEST